MGNELTIPEGLQAAGDKLALKLDGYNPVDDIFGTGSKVLAIREFMGTPDAMKYIKPLKGSSLGFKTDEASVTGFGSQADYDDKQVANVVTEALTHGFKLTNNEFNIIRGNFMGVLNGYRRSVKEYPGVTNFREPVTGEPKLNGNLVTIPVSCTYTFEGKEFTDTQDIILTKSNRDTTDAWFGKAKRRFLKDLLANISGKTIPDYDYEDNPEVVNTEINTGIKSKQEDSADIVDAIVVEKPAKKVAAKSVKKKVEPKKEEVKPIDLDEANAAAQDAVSEEEQLIETAPVSNKPQMSEPEIGRL